MRTYPLSSLLRVTESFDALQQFLEKLEVAVRAVIEEQAHLADGEQWEEGYEDQTYFHTLFEETFPRTLRYSTVLHAHAALDTLLSKLCDHVQDGLDLRFSRSDMANARELPTRIAYLQKALGDALPAGSFQGFLGPRLSALGGHLKTGQSWTGQNRPAGERPKHECSTPLARESASPRAATAG
jgi:hypothetical protein